MLYSAAEVGEKQLKTTLRTNRKMELKEFMPRPRVGAATKNSFDTLRIGG